MKKLMERIGATLATDDGQDTAGFPSRTNRAWNEQGDLFSRVTRQPAAPATAEARAPTKIYDFSESEFVRKLPKKESDAVAARSQARKAVYAEKLRGVRAQNIARFLEVNQAVQSRGGFAYRIIQAVRGVSADYDLWKGPTKQVTFLLG